MSEEWSSAKIIWITLRAQQDGSTASEVIYELEEDEENLKQVLVGETAIYLGAKRGDKIRIRTGSSPAIEPQS